MFRHLENRSEDLAVGDSSQGSFYIWRIKKCAKHGYHPLYSSVKHPPFVELAWSGSEGSTGPLHIDCGTRGYYDYMVGSYYIQVMYLARRDLLLATCIDIYGE